MLKGARRLSLVAVPALVVLAGCARIAPPAGSRALERTLTVTAYCPCGTCCGWHRNWLGLPVHSSGPQKGERKIRGLTASGAKARMGTIAADTSLYPFGTVMYIEGYGYGRVEDRGGMIKGQHIDLYFPSHRRAQEWGRQRQRVRIWL